VDGLTGIIRVGCPFTFLQAPSLISLLIQKIAAAWSRSNLPPHDLDLMFRSIESIYKADRSLLSVRVFDITQPCPLN
jgi:hypothetical protein